MFELWDIFPIITFIIGCLVAKFLHKDKNTILSKPQCVGKHYAPIIAVRNPTNEDINNFNHLDSWIIKGEKEVPPAVFLCIDKSINQKEWYCYRLIEKYQWHTLQDRVPIKGEKLLVRNTDGTTFEWEYGYCGSDHCRCDLRSKEFRVIEK